MHICTQINNENNDPIKVFMTFICDDGMKNWKKKYNNKKITDQMEVSIVQRERLTVIRCLSFKWD